MNFKRFFVLLLIGISLISASRVLALTPVEQEAQWRAELAATEADIAKWQAILDSTKQDTASLKRDAAVLNAKINQAKAFIKQKNIAIAQLDADIAAKNAHIQTLEEKINNSHDSLAQIIRKTNQLDAYSLPEVVLADTSISDFWSDAETFASVNRSMEDLLGQIRANKNLTEQEKAALDAQKTKEADTRAAAQVQQKQIQADETQKQYLIAVNNSKEKTYNQVLADEQAKAADIRAKLFHLAGGSAAIPFGTALQYAQSAGSYTGF